ncbi:MAG TPA: hypothetical protein VGK74_25655 [Symbiobacteriaceae bacterium]|jgi:2,3-bisphosphoglycerate-dependent phosphoglycerate mutase
MALMLKRYDDRFGFDEWAALTNPDVYRITLSDVAGPAPRLERIWRTG